MKSLTKYFFVGGICFLVDFAIFFVMAKQLGYNYLLVNILSFTIATSLNYLLCIGFVFKSGSSYKRRMEVFLLFCVNATSLSINQLMLYAFVDIFLVELLKAKATAVLLTFMFNYFMRKEFVFKVRRP